MIYPLDCARSGWMINLLMTKLFIILTINSVNYLPFQYSYNQLDSVNQAILFIKLI